MKARLRARGEELVDGRRIVRGYENWGAVYSDQRALSTTVFAVEGTGPLRASD
jgi:hypothetical protein